MCILSMFDEKKPPKTWPICDIVTGTMKSGLGHLLLRRDGLEQNKSSREEHALLCIQD